LAEHKPTTRAGKRYALIADVARFYPSIYSHSIPWALHGKALAKANKPSDLVGNALDKLVRDSQDGQTIRIPIGTDTSLLVAEIVMCAVDEMLSTRLHATGLRHIDDIELSFSRAADADAALGPLQEVLGQFELALNPLNTHIDKLPLNSEEAWLARVRSQTIRAKAGPQKRELINYL
jgi:hypothetical protein